MAETKLRAGTEISDVLKEYENLRLCLVFFLQHCPPNITAAELLSIMENENLPELALAENQRRTATIN